jgi:hypothetical protein
LVSFYLFFLLGLYRLPSPGVQSRSKSIVRQDRGRGHAGALFWARNLRCLAVGGKRLEFCHTTPTAVWNSVPIVDGCWNFMCCNEMQMLIVTGNVCVRAKTQAKGANSDLNQKLKYNSKHHRRLQETS